MAQESVEWDDEALRVIEQSSPFFATLARPRLEQIAIESRSKVTIAMIQELLQEVYRWGMDSVFGVYEPADALEIYSGFAGASDADEAAEGLSAGAAPKDLVDFCVDSAGLKPGDRVLDVGCGLGRVGVPLAMQGMAVVGIDAWADGLAVTAAWARREDLDFPLIEADLRDLPWKALEGEAGFDVVLSVGTLFEHFPDSDQQARELSLELNHLLKPGGRCLIFIGANHRDEVLRAAQIEPWSGTAVVQTWALRGPGHFLLNERRFRADEERFYNRYIHIEPRAPLRESREIVRSYTHEDLIKLLREAGLVHQRSWGAAGQTGPYTGPYTEYTPESRIMVVLAQKER